MKKCPTVVIVEDDPDIRESISGVLNEEGYETKAYANGREALEGLRSCRSPCLILLDIMMPVMNGWEFLKARSQLGDTLIATPVFVVSANATADEVRRSDAKGYIKKPIDVELLLKIVRDNCDNRTAGGGDDNRTAAA